MTPATKTGPNQDPTGAPEDAGERRWKPNAEEWSWAELFVVTVLALMFWRSAVTIGLWMLRKTRRGVIHILQCCAAGCGWWLRMPRRRKMLALLALLILLNGLGGTSRPRDRNFKVRRKRSEARGRKERRWESVRKRHVFNFDDVRGRRIGEALRPGPSGWKLSLQYLLGSSAKRKPSRQGGLARLNASKRRDDQSSPATDWIKFTTANGTCWSSIQAYVRHSNAHIICAQEHHLEASQTEEASQWCLRNGFKSVWGAATLSSSTGRTSGGTLLLVRKQFGLTEATELVTPSDRMVAGKVDVPGYRQLLVTSTYFQTAIGMKTMNLELTRAIKEAHDKWNGPAIVGGDFNNTPAELAATLAGSRSGTKITAPYAPRGTCSGTGGGRLIDFFLVTADLALGIAEVRVDYMAGLAPHRPVDLYLLSNLSSWRVRKLSKPPALPTAHVVGPSWQNGGWVKIQEELKELREKEDAGAITAEDRRGLVNALLHQYADLAEGELISNGGEAKGKRNQRCRGAYVTWQPILQDRPMQQARLVAACRWTKQVVSDIEKANNGTRSEVDGLLYGLEKAREAAKDDIKLIALMDEAIKLAREWKSCTQEETRARLEKLTAAIEAEVEEKITLEKTQGIAAWRQWLKADADLGNGHAHAYSRLPQAWISREAKGDDGILTGDPTQLMEEDRKKFYKLWESSDTAQTSAPKYGRWEKSDELRELNGDDILEAAKTFGHGTSSTYDGLHPRHFAMLSPQGRTTTAALLEFFEHTGEWPAGIEEVVISLIPKATGGTRPIGLFSGLYRLWTRVRKVEATEWERENSRSYFAARGGNGALDTVWQQAFRAERNTGKGGSSAAVLVDLKSFYDHFHYGILKHRADEGGFPKKITNLALKAYEAGRRIMQEGLVADPIFTGRGVVAGCGFATTWVKIYCKGPLDAFQKRHPFVRLDTYVDDFTLSVDADTDIEARVLVTLAALDLKQVIEKEMKCKLALDKSVVVASNDKLAQDIADELGTLGVVPRAATANLGVDFSVGKKRKTQTANDSKRAGRFQKGEARKRRVKKVRKAVG